MYDCKKKKKKNVYSNEMLVGNMVIIVFISK